MIALMVLMILLGSTYWVFNFTCAICGNKLTAADRASNGRIRYKRVGTNMPVCKWCARSNPEEVE